MRRFFSFFYFFAVLSLTSFQSVQAQEVKSKVKTAFESFIKNPSLQNGMASLTVINSKTGEIVFDSNNQIGMPTASTLKVITSITALDLLGADFTFQTDLSYTGEIDSLGTLNGNIIIDGKGDPTLGSDRYPQTKPEVILANWAAAIKKLGIKNINGKIIADDKLFNGYDVPGTWMWTDIGNYYGAGVSALNWKENKLGINFTSSKPGQPATLNPVQKAPFYNLINEVKTGSNGSGDKVYAYSAPYSTDVFLRGTYGADLKKTIEISVPDPALDLAYSLYDVLQRDSILIADSVTTAKRLMNIDSLSLMQGNRNLILATKSPRMGEIIHWFNQKSINLYGEALLKLIGGVSAMDFNTENAANLVSKYWQNKLSIPPSAINTFDGSGLSPQNRVTTQAMAKIMQYAKGRPWYDEFLKSLPKINNTSMKSGTIGGVLGYTGYQIASDGQEYTFALLVNNYQGPAGQMRQRMFKLLDALK
ncbi:MULTISPECIES: D-alanyl-D-alanine carboxypeptidase/D-alanyl-D-alanine endopeptidase [Sphingobacterium]|uniref:Peptidase M15 n=1 Tax=Sphingobacterium cellulitidis TaxID=1768011 RepID=A0A8H9FVZ7_9SPHI|nr:MULTISPECIES: D-alanyl-D-alanine carboxypeptidase/D-alanyl-D-alanine-endopeptidase [Sphingobacterium]MBA8985521.1 D-alanyl-D-alanine carboxypeptidase/D-alanyl-D-alanine-endopeptidase (penicillin-binding protein 4) [Sphingobacterium soli]WFB63942.1 D-alanyl-D-alanine carboxypeptidase/D-alanyl-D-alanine-endopeptidase [Sphingobacterium sp. WM]GGE09062.1 peptidase M15 [Sphingobacterium soli]